MTPTTSPATLDEPEIISQLAAWSAAAQHARTQSNQMRDRLYTAVRTACATGMPIAAVSRHSGLDRATVRRLRDTPTQP